MSAPHRGRPARRQLAAIPGVLLVAAAWLPAMLTVLLAVATQRDWSGVLRLVVTAVVYAPVAAIVVSLARRGVAAILGSLAIASGWLAFVVVARGVTGLVTSDAVVATAAVVARQPEIAALSIMPWLLTSPRARGRAAGVAVGGLAVGLDIVISGARAAGLEVPRGVVLLPLAVALSSLIAAIVAHSAEWRRGSPGRREALNWSAAGAALLVMSYLRVVASPPPLLAALGDAAFVLAQGLLPTGIIALVLQGRAGGTVQRHLGWIVWAQSLAFAVSLYLLVSAVAIHAGVPATVAGGFAAGALALTFSSVTGFVRRRTRRLYFGPGADARTVLSQLGDRIAVAHGAGSGLQGLAESLRAVWQLSSVTITPWTAESETASIGDPGAARIDHELRVGGRTVGRLELTSDDADALRQLIVPLLDRIGTLIGAAVLLAVVNHEVVATRQRTLEVRQEERWMLHRELRDDLAPALAGIGYGMAAARPLVASGVPGAVAAVETLRRQLADRAEEVRRLARAMLPAALDAGDLDGALHELARRFSDRQLAVTVRAQGVDVLAADTQLAVYLIVTEAVSRWRRIAEVRELAIVVELDHDEVAARLEADRASADVEGWTELVEALERRVADVGGRVVIEAPGSPALCVVVPR